MPQTLQITKIPVRADSSRSVRMIHSRSVPQQVQRAEEDAEGAARNCSSRSGAENHRRLFSLQEISAVDSNRLLTPKELLLATDEQFSEYIRKVAQTGYCVCMCSLTHKTIYHWTEVSDHATDRDQS